MQLAAPMPYVDARSSRPVERDLGPASLDRLLPGEPVGGEDQDEYADPKDIGERGIEQRKRNGGTEYDRTESEATTDAHNHARIQGRIDQAMRSRVPPKPQGTHLDEEHIRGEAQEGEKGAWKTPEKSRCRG